MSDDWYWSKCWKDADGNEYVIDEMKSESYIENCIKAIERNGKGNVLGGPDDTLSAKWMEAHSKESLKALKARLKELRKHKKH